MAGSTNLQTGTVPLKHRSRKQVIGGYYTFGGYDVVIIIEAPNDEAVMSLMLKVGSAGNVRTKTLKAFTADEGMKIIRDLP